MPKPQVLPKVPYISPLMAQQVERGVEEHEHNHSSGLPPFWSS